MTLRKKPSNSLEAAKTPRGYVHFDVRPSDDVLCKLVTDPVAVSRHAFFPLLRLDVIRNRVRREGRKKIWGVKVREIRYASHVDSAIYAYYAFELNQIYEKRLAEEGLEGEVLAFRALGKCNIDFATEAFAWIAANRPCVALGFDVKDFFGSLDHELLKAQWSELLSVRRLPEDHYAVFRSIAKYASIDLIAARKALGISRSQLEMSRRLCSVRQFREVLRPSGLITSNDKDCGIPQGSPISALLSNVYMLPFDRDVSSAVRAIGGLYRRYCDDILVAVPVGSRDSAVAAVKAAIAKAKLSLQEKKTVEANFKESSRCELPYLGLVFDGHRTLLRPAGVANYYTKMRGGVRLHREASTPPGKKPLLIQRRKKLLNAYTKHAPLNHRSYVNYVRRVSATSGSTGPVRQIDRHERRFCDELAKGA